MAMLDEDRLTELFAHTVVLERRAAALLQVLNQDNASLEAIRDEGSRVYRQVARITQIVYALTNVDPELVLTLSDYQSTTAPPGT